MRFEPGPGDDFNNSPYASLPRQVRRRVFQRSWWNKTTFSVAGLHRSSITYFGFAWAASQETRSITRTSSVFKHASYIRYVRYSYI
jgi:hypothetical protein